MQPDDRALLQEASERGELRAPLAARIREHRRTTQEAAQESAQALTSRLATVHPPGAPGWRVLPLGEADGLRLGQISAAHALHTVTAQEEDLLRHLDQDLLPAIQESRPLLGLRRFLTWGARKETAERAAGRLLMTYQEWGSATTADWLHRLDAQGREPALPLALTSALDPGAGLRQQLAGPVAHEEVVRAEALAGRSRLVLGLARVITRAQQAREEAVAAAEQVREAVVTNLLAGMPVDRLRQATGERLRIGALQEAGISTVAGVLEQEDALEHLPGVGPVTARRMIGAAQTLRALALQDVTLRPDPADRRPEMGELLRALHTWEVVGQCAKASDLVARAQALQDLAERVDEETTHLALLSRSANASSTDFLEMVDAVLTAAADLETTLRALTEADPWEDFTRRPATYFALLSDLGLMEETGTYGDVPDDVIEEVRGQELDGTRLEVSLRGYQGFAARFALVQGKVIIGDEMGLGKTIEALAVIAHRASEGARWFLVVCPAAVLSNWVREIADKTALTPKRLHGPDRDDALREWQRDGGIAVTSYSTLGSVWDGLDGFEVDALVVDEAHYVKNPEALRSQRVARLIRRTEHVMLLTGTPMENDVSEFATLVRYVHPDLLPDRGLDPVEFRAAVAPVYLRRNTEDVLVELPELVEVDEWLELSAADELVYRAAVAEGNFMEMRRAAFRSGPASAKVARLVEIVEEAEQNGRRVLVFSYFREVLDRVAAAAPGTVFGPLTGSVSPAQRQETVDAFSATAGGAVLIAQIQAVGVGLNIQAASVVVICEPQLKPTAEWQAIARARRMGQLESVQVHRLLAEDSVDERLREILSGKTLAFDRYARVSATAQSAPEAYDLSEADLVRRVLAAERERLFPDAG